MSVYISGPKKGRRARDPFLVAKRKRPTVKSVARSVKRMQKHIELKHKDTSPSGFPSVAGSLTLLNDIAQGLTEATRIGDEIYATSIQYRGILTAGTSTLVTTSSNSTRIIVFWDQQANGSAPTVTDLLDTSAGGNGIISPYNDDYQKRFKVIYDRTFSINPNQVVAGTGQQNYQIPLRFKRKLGRTVKYDGTTAVIGSIETNSLYMLRLAESDTTPMLVGGVARLIYKDQ